MRKMAAPKKLVILDLDNTIIDTLQVWGTSLQKLINDFSHYYKVAPATIHELIREAPGQYRFNDGVSLQDWMIESDPRLRDAHKKLNRDWIKAGNPIKRDWLDHTAQASVFYDGVLPMLQQWKETGTEVVIQTDAEDSAVIRRLWLLGKNAADQKLLQSPQDILELFGKIYCQPGIAYSPEYMSGVELSFMNAMNQKLHRWDDRLYKPAPSHLRRVLADAGVSPEQTVYVGDTHKDGVEAKSLSSRLAFAWSSYGARATDEVLALYSEVGSKSYMYGFDAIRAELLNRGVEPDVVLKHSFAELSDHFSWQPK